MESSDREDFGNSVGNDRRNPHILGEEARAKATVSKTAADRVHAFERAKRFLPVIEQARSEIEREYHRKLYQKDVSLNAIAKWLNEFSEANGNAFNAPHGGKWSGKQVAKNILGAPDLVVEAAVLECRTRMTALALSADFAKPIEAVTELEQEYLGYIAEALDLEHRLNGDRQRSREELVDEARYKALEVAAYQRRKKPVSMMARERLWKHLPPVVRKVFEKLGRAEPCRNGNLSNMSPPIKP